MLFFGAHSLVNASQKSFSIDLIEKGTDVYYLSAQLGGNIDTELLFDTGSGYLAINEVTLKSLTHQGIATYERSINARLASGRTRKVAIYNISSLRLGNDCLMHNIEAAILPGNTRNILGMNVLKRVDSFSISLHTSQLTLSGCASGDPALAMTP